MELFKPDTNSSKLKRTLPLKVLGRLPTYIIVVLFISCVRQDFEIADELVTPEKATKEVLVRNKVESVTERHCFQNADNSCTVIDQKYDRRGNMIEYGMHRMGSRYGFDYDENDHLIARFILNDTNGYGTTYTYDEKGDLVGEIGSNWKINRRYYYDSQGREIKHIENSDESSGSTIRKTVTKKWTDFDKILSEMTYTFLEGQNLDSPEPIQRKKYEYDLAHNLIGEIHLEDSVITKRIEYTYDSQNRLREYYQDDLAGAKRMTESGYKGGLKNGKLETRISYLENGLVDQEYFYLSDPCMGLENHFLFVYSYKENGLREKAEVFEDGKLAFYISYEYEFW